MRRFESSGRHAGVAEQVRRTRLKPWRAATLMQVRILSPVHAGRAEHGRDAGWSNRKDARLWSGKVQVRILFRQRQGEVPERSNGHSC
jgi:hypothetical protein